EDHLGHALDHEIDDQEHAEHEEPSFGLAQQEQAHHDGEHDGDQLQPEMRHLLRPDQADALHHTADDQDPGEQIDDRHRGDQRIDQSEHAGHHHQYALEQIPKRITLHRFAHRFTHGRGGGFERNGSHGRSLL